MSSNCSINCCSSPEVTSSNVSVNNMNGVASNETSGGRVRTTVPDTKKDNKYWERRRRNNEAARRSREKRRQNDMVMDKRILELSQRNKQLENELFQLKMNFGLVNDNQTKLELDDSSFNLLSPPAIHEPSINNNKNNNNNNNNNSADHINGMIFPVFTAFPPGTNETLESSDKSNPDGVNISGATHKVNENSKTCTNPNNKYQANLITLSNIPFLSNLITPPNFKDDIASKATLLLPSLMPKTQIKPLDNSISSCSFNNAPLLQVDELTFNITQDLPKICNKQTISAEKPQLLSNGNQLKIDLQEILDLSLKQENTDCFFVSPDEPSHSLNHPLESNEPFDSDNKDAVTHSSSDNQSIDESMTNSFLSGILSANSKNRLSVCMKRKSSTNQSPISCLNNNKTRKCNSPSDNVIKSECGNEPKSNFNTFQNNLNMKTRLFIRREVSAIVVNENRKLRKDIENLNSEIKLLKSVMLECANLSVTGSLSTHHNSSLLEQQTVDNLPDENRGIFA